MILIFILLQEILGDMVEIESTEKRVSYSVSKYAESVLLNNGFQEGDLEVVGPAEASKGFMPSIVAHLKIPSL